MADLISIDDNGTLTFVNGASADVFGLTAPNDLEATITAAADASALTILLMTLGSPEGRIEQSASLWWQFSLGTDGSLIWSTTDNPVATPAFSGSNEGCAGPSSGSSTEGCAGASSSPAIQGCTTNVATAPGRC